jgi:hypothetical protein
VSLASDGTPLETSVKLEKQNNELKSNLEKYKASIMPPEVGDWEAPVASAGN